ncbi:MAG: SDR family NAD(P)-dependent oxidoreductase [Gammaproteobacteria bacterium]|nr:SDR family NAD(P)-dependent oxidoreductase [Gammaproteobacteria bacterium]
MGNGRTVLVTGGARGIGKGIAKSFLEAKHDVMIADLGGASRGSDSDWAYDLSTDADTTATLAELEPLGNVSYTHVDVTDAESCRAAVQATLDAFGRLDVLVNNAGVLDTGPTDEFTEAQWDRVFSVNVKGVFLMTKAAIASLRQSADAAIVNTASIAGKRGAARLAAYCGSKFAVVGITQSFAQEFARDGIRVNAVCPGMVGTAMWLDHLMANQGEEAFGTRMEDLIPLGRAQTAEDMGQAAVYLATAPNVSGVALNVAGAYEMH